MAWYENIHGLSVHLHTGILVVSLITALMCVVIRLIIFLYPRWGLVRDIFTDWEFTKKIWDNRTPIFKAFDYTTLGCITFGIIGLVIGIWTGGNEINWDFTAWDMRAKLTFSVYALLVYGIALTIRGVFRNSMWRTPGLIVIYGLAIGFGFFFVFITGALGGLITYNESIAEPLLKWLQDIGFFNLFGITGPIV